MFLQTPPPTPPVPAAVQVQAPQPAPQAPPARVAPVQRRVVPSQAAARRVPKGARVWYWPPMGVEPVTAPGSATDARAATAVTMAGKGGQAGNVAPPFGTLPTLEPIYFPSGSSEVHHGKRNLMAMAAYLKGNPQMSVACIGFTDPRGTNKAAHQKLSLARAGAVKAELMTLGVKPEQIKVEGRGSDPGTVKGPQEDKHWTARRVEVRVEPPAQAQTGAPQKREPETEKVTAKEGA